MSVMLKGSVIGSIDLICQRLNWIKFLDRRKCIAFLSEEVAKTPKTNLTC